MELGYLRRLHLETAGRVSFGEGTRPAVPSKEQSVDQTLISEVLASVIFDIAVVIPDIINPVAIERLANRFFDRGIAGQSSRSGFVYKRLSAHLMRHEVEI